MHEIVKEYYGESLKSSSDLKTNACCDPYALPSWMKKALVNIHPEVLSKYYGCGLVCPSELKGARILDLGCGAGRDVYLLSQLVGPEGHVVGVDMTDQQLETAIQHKAYHVETVGYDNVEFLKGYIESLDQLGLEPQSFDVIVSNCVVNLSPDKPAVLKGVRSLLKPGGEFYFSDVYSERRVPLALQTDPLVYGECLGGALYWNDFLQLAKASGFADPRLVEDKPIITETSELKAKLGNLKFYSATYRLFAIDELEPSCEDFGQAIAYKGTIESFPEVFILDKHHVFETGKVYPVCGNTFLMLNKSRFKSAFEFYGDFSKHLGIFPGCGEALPYTNGSTELEAAGCC